jgi:poly-gamma-glutamate synthesis protein (capsule biosynthesis protein)
LTPEGTLLLTGDLILDEPDPDLYFVHARPLLSAADLVIGHVEVPFTVRDPDGGPNPNPGREPEKLQALARAGFGVATLAGNHVYDAGREGVEDTLAALRRCGLRTAGAGLDLDEARLPAVVEAMDARVGVLSFNCVGPHESWAGPHKAGCAYVEVLTHYELDHATPGGPPSRILTFPVPETQSAMEEDVARAREQVDVLVVALHKGVAHTPAKLASYERPLARAAIDAGADLVVSHHAHILRGVEVYRGRPIFHGLGNFVTVTRVLNTTDNPNPQMLEWARRRRELFGFEPDPRLPTYPFHPDSRNTMVASCTFGAGGLSSAGYIPCWIEEDGRPRPLARPESEAVAAYVERIGMEAGLKASFEWEDDRVVFWRSGG